METNKRRRPTIKFSGQGRTRQEQSADADINNIMGRFLNQGVQPRIREGEGNFGDFRGSDDYLGILQEVTAAQAAFNSLPSKVRTYCDNDVSVLLTLLEDPRECDKLQELGLNIERAPSLSTEPKATPVPPAEGDPESHEPEPPRSD